MTFYDGTMVSSLAVMSESAYGLDDEELSLSRLRRRVLSSGSKGRLQAKCGSGPTNRLAAILDGGYGNAVK